MYGHVHVLHVRDVSMSVSFDPVVVLVGRYHQAHFVHGAVVQMAVHHVPASCAECGQVSARHVPDSSGQCEEVGSVGDLAAEVVERTFEGICAFFPLVSSSGSSGFLRFRRRSWGFFLVRAILQLSS